MAGGVGSRMGTCKKMLLEINGEKIIDMIVKQLKEQNFRVSMCISKNTEFLDYYPEVAKFYGKGNYTEDLKYAISQCSLPVLVISADLIFPTDLLYKFIKKADLTGTGVATLIVNGELSGISMFFEKPEDENLQYKNINISTSGFFNLNRKEDYEKAVKYYKNNSKVE